MTTFQLPADLSQFVETSRKRGGYSASLAYGSAFYHIALVIEDQIMTPLLQAFCPILERYVTVARKLTRLPDVLRVAYASRLHRQIKNALRNAPPEQRRKMSYVRWVLAGKYAG